MIESVPAARAVVAHAAAREEVSGTAEQPLIAVPFELNATVPVGVGGPAGLIVAVKVTDSRKVNGFTLETSVVVEAKLFTTCDSVALLLVRWLASPEYTALIESVPTASELVTHAAVLDVNTVTAEHPLIAVPFELNETVPVGVGGPAGVMVAVKVTDCPAIEGFKLDARAVAEAVLFTTCDSAALLLVT